MEGAAEKINWKYRQAVSLRLISIFPEGNGGKAGATGSHGRRGLFVCVIRICLFRLIIIRYHIHNHRLLGSASRELPASKFSENETRGSVALQKHVSLCCFSFLFFPLLLQICGCVSLSDRITAERKGEGSRGMKGP